MSSRAFLSRGIDYLGDLGAKLRDLQGFRTLAHELIQNADDSANASWMRFMVGQEALLVDNDGVFSDCEDIEAPECPWKATAKGHRCDFHRFRFVASGDKRRETGTTGAFGIGFIAVYQITDQPEVISGGRHWILREDREEKERIEVCSGCKNCAGVSLPGTRFIFPWARSRDSALRTALGADPVDSDALDRMLSELKSSVPVAMLFLRRLRKVEVGRDGRVLLCTERVDERDSLILATGKRSEIWHLVKGNFDEVAAAMRLAHPGRIELKRSSDVTLAIPQSELKVGLMCSGLPTEHTTGFPFHMNADVYTTNDRKRVLFADDFQAQWNRSALVAAAQALSQSIDRLPQLFGAVKFWSMVTSLKDVADKADAGQAENALAEFWRRFSPRLKTAPVVQTSKERWALPSAVSLLSNREESEAIPVLEALGLEIVHESLRPHQTILRSQAVGIPILELSSLAGALRSAGLVRRIAFEELPAGLNNRATRDIFYREIAVLLDRSKSQRSRSEAERLLADLSLAPGRDGALWPISALFSADAQTVRLFEKLPTNVVFVANDKGFEPLVAVCKRFDSTAAIAALENMDDTRLESEPERNQLMLLVLQWFEARKHELSDNPELLRALSGLAIFPSAGGLRPVSHLALPGDFIDPLSLTEVVDASVVEKIRPFLRFLGMPELNFVTYAASRLPQALANPSVNASKRHSALVLLSMRLGEMKDREDVRQALLRTRIVRCNDGEYREPSLCYFDSEEVRECLGSEAIVAVLPTGHERASRDLLEWLGVTANPRFIDLTNRLIELASRPYSAVGRKRVQKVASYLASQHQHADDAQLSELAPLRSQCWLPARGRTDRWYAPSELFASFQDYLFESQAQFVDFPSNVQRECSGLFDLLGIRGQPPVVYVVKHLLFCSNARQPVNAAVYRFLNDNAGDVSLSALLGHKCLFFGNAYYPPKEVFWGESAFGRYRQRLSTDLRMYAKLLDRLGVRESPTYQDAFAVIHEISAEFGGGNVALDEEAHSVLMSCWRVLDRGLSDKTLGDLEVQRLRELKCVPKLSRVLNPPIWMFFENRAGLASKFGDFLVGNVIPRPLDASLAMTVAGVRPLGSAVEVQLLEFDNPQRDLEMENRIQSRINEIARVLSAHGMVETSAALERLSSIQCHRADRIEIRYQLTLFDREQNSPSESVPALFSRDQEALLFTGESSGFSWASLARELAVGLFPEQDPGVLAAGFKEVLAASTDGEAAAILDELGYGRLDTLSSVQPSPEIRSELGDSSIAPESPHGEPEVMEEENSGEEQQQQNPAQPLSPAPLVYESPPNPSNRPAEKTSPSTKTLPTTTRPVLRSYIPAPKRPDETRPDGSEQQAHRDATDSAGVALVVEYEVRAGRTPSVMDHNHKGYDVESCDANGHVLRYIEIKSMSKDWNIGYAILSKSQFDEARMRMDSFWLYVVERAGSADAKLHRICNPATHANQFLFDDGWRAMSEDVIGTEEEPLLVTRAEAIDR